MPVLPFPNPVAAPQEQNPLMVLVSAEGVDMPQLDADGTMTIPLPDGSLTIDLDPKEDKEDSEFNDNLAEIIPESELDRIGSELLEGIEADKRSRAEWMAQFERGMDILGLKLEMPRTDVGSSAPLEGMSTVRHPLLQQAILFFQANFRGEMLPASGPVKVSTYGDEPEEIDGEAEMLAEDMNYWITNVATVLGKKLREGSTKSCGCLRREVLSRQPKRASFVKRE